MNRLLFVLLLASYFSISLEAQVLSIAEARLLPPGTMVTVRGIVTNGGELGKIRYMQDGTAGIGAYPGSGSASGFETAAGPGDSIEVSGTLVVYHNLLEITPISAYQVISVNNPMPSPKSLDLSNISDNLEGQLVEIDCATIAGSGSNFTSGSFQVNDANGGTGNIYLPFTSSLVGDPIPNAPVLLVSVLSRYDDFQLLPRDQNDFLPANCFYFVQDLEQTNIQTTGFTVSWKTNLSAGAILHYGTSPSNLSSSFNIPATATEHTFPITSLQPGTIYWVQIEAQENGNSIFSKMTPFATRSLSSGQIKVYFNHPIETSLAGGLLPDGQSAAEVIGETIARIDAATQTIDVAMYNNNRIDLTAALKDAYIRGVQVRYVAALDASSTALNDPPPFPVVYGNSVALMHNKFMVIDADLSDKAWVMSGSLNWTNGNINTDFNNTLFIQDQSLARTYEIEFEEMWGSSAALPDLSQGRFGPAKFDNTPHHFIVGNIPLESYFSPSDRVTTQIQQALESIDYEAQFAMFSFTKNELGEALANAFVSGAEVRGMIENTSDVGCEYTYLLNQGLDVQKHSFGGDLHHKYGVIDAGHPDSDPTVVTGSHNWTLNAETNNDENTVVIHDNDIAILYRAEFERRLAENLSPVQTPVEAQFVLFPNPAQSDLLLQGTSEGIVTVKDVIGCQRISSNIGAGGVTRLDVSSLTPGYYFAIIQTAYGLQTIPFQKI